MGGKGIRGFWELCERVILMELSELKSAIVGLEARVEHIREWL